MHIDYIVYAVHYRLLLNDRRIDRKDIGPDNHKPLSPSQYSQLSQHTSTINIGATFRSIDLNERMWEVSMLIQEYTFAPLTTRPIMLSRRYEYYVVPNIQALSSVLVISHINEDGGDQHASY